jgi:hypothetical protein
MRRFMFLFSYHHDLGSLIHLWVQQWHNLNKDSGIEQNIFSEKIFTWFTFLAWCTWEAYNTRRNSLNIINKSNIPLSPGRPGAPFKPGGPEERMIKIIFIF